MKKFSFIILSSLMLCNTALAADEGMAISGIRSLNNFEKSIDNKDPSFSEDVKNTPLSYGKVEYFDHSGERNTTDLTKIRDRDSRVKVPSGGYLEDLTTTLKDSQLAWLIENNVVSRDKKITVSGSEISIGIAEPLFDYNNPNESVTKTDFLVGLYKSIYGPLNSRRMLINVPSVRNAGEIYYYYDKKGNRLRGVHPKREQQVSRNGKTYMYTPQGGSSDIESSFPHGDYYSYVTQNVPELYLKELLDKNIITLGELSDLSFSESYKSLGTNSGGKINYPLWYNKLLPFSLNNPVQFSQQNLNYDSSSLPLGASYEVSGLNIGALSGPYSPTLTIDRVEWNYFINESIDSMGALKYVESLLRLTEKDMTETEAQIVTYKYGSSYLNFLNEQDRRTVMFLTAKGVLNFEDKTEYRNLYGALTKEFYYKLLYRVANKDARLNFSEIKLTDSDNFWIGKGFTEVTLKVNTVNPGLKPALDNLTQNIMAAPDIRTKEVKEYSPVATRSVEGRKLFASIRHKSFFFADSNPSKDYEVTKVFDKLDKYSYQGKELSSLVKGDKVSEDIISHKKANEFDSNSEVYEVKFKIKATSEGMAVATIDSRLQSLWHGFFVSEQINAVTKYTVDSNNVQKKITLVPASLFKTKESTIVVLEDKVLMNRETGATAVLLQDKDIALVGTHVIQSKDLMVTPINGEKYYNMDIVSKLMSNMYISQIDPTSIYFTRGITEERLATIKAPTGSILGKTYVAKFNTGAVQGDDSSVSQTSAYFANISQMTAGENIIIKDFEATDSKTDQRQKFKAVLEFNYQQPPSDISFGGTGGISDNPTLKEVNDFFYKSPSGCTDPVKEKDSSTCNLLDWWNNNIHLSNAFANVFYGTQGLSYIRTGYLVPKVTLLYDDKTQNVSQYVNSILQQVGAELPKSWVSRFLGDELGYNSKLEESVDKINGDGIYYPKKPELTVRRYPKWMHTMFNNSSGLGTDFVGRLNGVMWRQMMAQRTFDEIVGAQLVENNYQYVTKNGTFIVTNGGDGAVYKQIDPGDRTVRMSFDDQGNILYLNTRTDTEFVTKNKHQTVKLGTHTFFVLDVEGNKMQLVDTAVITGNIYPSQRGGVSSYDINGAISGNGLEGSKRKDAIRSRYLELQSAFICKPNVTDRDCSNYEDSVSTFDEAKHVTARSMSIENGGHILFMDDKGLDGSGNSDHLFLNTDTANRHTYDEISSDLISAQVRIDVKLNYWFVDEEGNLKPRRLPSAFQVPNMYYSSMTKGVIDSIMAASISAMDPNDIPDGGKLYVGDILFTKVGNRFVSYPVTHNEDWKGLVGNATNSEHVSNEIARRMNTFSLRAGSSDIPLPAFFTGSGMSMPVLNDPLDKTLIGEGSTISVASTNNKKEQSREPYDPNSISGVKSLVFYITFDKGLLARPINNETKTYQLLLSTNSLSEGNLPKIPFFSESLSMQAKEDLYLAAIRSDFKPMNAASDFKNKFLNMYSEGLRKDVATFLRMAFTTFLMWSIFISWLCYLILRFELMTTVLRAWRDPVVGSQKNGFDLLKFISFGFFNLDSEPSGLKIAISTIIMFFIIYILVNVLGK